LAASLLALVGTGLIGLLFVSLFDQKPGKLPKAPNPISLRSVPQSLWEQNRRLGPRPDLKTPPPPQQQPKPDAVAKAEDLKKQKEPEAIPKGRVVDVAPGNGQVPDEDAQFLAESNNRVDKETRSKDATPFYKNAMPRPSSPVKPSDGQGHDVVDKQVVAGNGGKGNEETPAKNGSKKNVFEVPSAEKHDELALRFDGLNGMLKNQPGSEAIKGNSDRLKIQVGGPEGEESQASSGRAGDNEIRTLTPSATVLDRIAGAPANDLTPLDEVEVGNGTYLNTREWKYSSFFNRIKQYVGMHWDPNTVVRTKDPTGEIFLYKDRYTVVAVTLDNQGLLKNISVDKSCGVEFLDAEAMQAFRRAQPFPNPPPALQNDHGEIRFTFGFFLEVNKGGLQLFKPARQ
jgi:TonB family protein